MSASTSQWASANRSNSFPPHAAMDRLGNAAGKVDDDLCFHQGTVAGQNAIPRDPASSKYPARCMPRPTGPAVLCDLDVSDGQRWRLVRQPSGHGGTPTRWRPRDRPREGDGRNKLRRGCPPVHFARSIVSRLQVADEVSVLMRSCSSAGFFGRCRYRIRHWAGILRHGHRPCGLVLMLPVCRPIWVIDGGGVCRWSSERPVVRPIAS